MRLSPNSYRSLVSVVIPTYNSASYIVETIESVLGQTFRNFEIIVVDDGSSDHTRDLLQPYVESGAIRYVYQDNRGPGAARNMGILSANGIYIAFLDADDTLTKDSLERRLALLSSDPGLQFLFSDYYLQAEQGQGEESKEPGFGADQLGSLAEATSHGFIIKGLFQDILGLLFDVWTGTVLVRKRLLEEVGLFRTDLSVFEDGDLWIRLAKRCDRIGYVNQPLAYFKRFRGHLSASNREEYSRDGLRALHEHLDQNRTNSKASRTLKRRIALECH